MFLNNVEDLVQDPVVIGTWRGRHPIAHISAVGLRPRGLWSRTVEYCTRSATVLENKLDSSTPTRWLMLMPAPQNSSTYIHDRCGIAQSFGANFIYGGGRARTTQFQQERTDRTKITWPYLSEIFVRHVLLNFLISDQAPYCTVNVNWRSLW
jgi:hypothetical protein